MNDSLRFCHFLCPAVLALVGAMVMPSIGADDTTTKEANDGYGPGFTIRVVDEQGEPVEGALAGITARHMVDGTWSFGSNDKSLLTDADGLLHLLNGAKLLEVERWALVALHEGKALVGIVAVTEAQPDDQGVRTITVAPACRVTGSLSCPELTKLGRPVGWTIVDVYSGDLQPLSSVSEEQKYAFWLPAGEYELEAYGARVHKVRRMIRIEPSQTELVVPPIELSAVRHALLEGEPAPELRDIAAWKNTQPLRLKDLRGKYVLLDFWGHWCGPCIAQMPRLFEIYKRYGRDRLEIVGVHVGLKDESVESVEQLNELLAEARAEHWSGRELPFPVALSRSRATQHHGTERQARSAAVADYGILFFPTTVLIDPGGNVVGEIDSAIDAKDWNELDRLLGKESP